MLHTSRTNPTRMGREALPPWLTGAQRKALATGPDT